MFALPRGELKALFVDSPRQQNIVDRRLDFDQGVGVIDLVLEFSKPREGLNPPQLLDDAIRRVAKPPCKLSYRGVASFLEFAFEFAFLHNLLASLSVQYFK